MKRVAILGSTGSIGTQALEVIREHSDRFEVEVLAAGSNYKLLAQQALEFRPNAVVIANDDKYADLKQLLDNTDIKVYAGAAAMAQIVEMSTIDIVLTAMVGFAGLLPTINAVKAGKTIALANKETLVVAGELVTQLAREHRVAILPVDSEHSAIFQCLAGEGYNPIEKIILTASGGPFRTASLDFLRTATKHQALKHPNWDMGAKITIDSASMMNKGLEIIEAKWLFDLAPEQIDVIVHPQSIIHSMVQFTDGSIKAQMGLPDMKLPIQYALSYPDRLSSASPRFNFVDYPQLTFEQPDVVRFPNLRFAQEALRHSGSQPCVLNAANEVVVAAFLDEKIGFMKMSEIIGETIEKMPFKALLSFDDFVDFDREARIIAAQLVK